MLWDEVESDSGRRRFGIALTVLVPRLGWGLDAIEQSSLAAWRSRDAWKKFFPAGCRDAIWYISGISDASMAHAFKPASAARMSEVIAVRQIPQIFRQKGNVVRHMPPRAGPAQNATHRARDGGLRPRGR
jgi:hypothetical protein